MPRTDEKIIYYEPAARVQNSEWNLINNPPEGYRFILGQKSLVDKLATNRFMFNKIRLQVADHLVPLNLVKARIDTLKKLPPMDLIYSYNHIVPRSVPWVVSVEWGHVLVGRHPRFFTKYKKAVEMSLGSSQCKGIFTWTERAKRSILEGYDTSTFLDKIRVIPPAIPVKDYVRDYTRSKVRLLFVGSIDTVEDFYAKGGIEVVRAFRILRHRHPQMELTVRANIPNEFTDVDGIRVIRNILTREELDNEFKQADIFVLPSHYAQEMVVLEAMSWGLPVVASYIATFGEYIRNEVTGFVLQQPEEFPYFINHMLTSETTYRHKLVREVKNSGNTSLPEIVEVLSLLIENASLRERIGKEARNEIAVGSHSLQHRNALLKEVLDEATQTA